MADHVNHPDHYGGDTLYETIKVLEAWMASDDFTGFLRGNAIKYLSRAERKGDPIGDLEKARFYINYELGFLSRRDEEEPVLERIRTYWTEALPEPTPDIADCMDVADTLEIVAIHSNVDPHCRWGVRFPIDDEGGDEIEFFGSREKAERFVESLTAPRKRTKNAPGRRRG